LARDRAAAPIGCTIKNLRSMELCDHKAVIIHLV
jgi:hypothetical protein